jgi:hypothetical protein
METYCIFGVGGFTDLYLKKGQAFLHLILSSLLDYDVSMHGFVELVVVNPTSQDHQKWSSDAQVIAIFVLLSLPGQIIRPKLGRPPRNSAKDFWRDSQMWAGFLAGFIQFCLDYPVQVFLQTATFWEVV